MDSIQVTQGKLIPNDIDLTSQIASVGHYVCTPIDSELICEPITERWKFYYPLSRDFRGTEDDLKLLTCPGDGYVPDRPWCKFPRAYNYELDIYLDLTPHTIYSE